MVTAAKQGCYMGSSPIGYTNSRDLLENAILKPNERAQEIKRMFKEVAMGTKSVSQVRSQLRIKESISTCQRILRNKVYIGKVRVPEYKGASEYWVKGLHEAIIDETTFYQVQDVLDGRVVKLTLSIIRKEMIYTSEIFLNVLYVVINYQVILLREMVGCITTIIVKVQVILHLEQI